MISWSLQAELDDDHREIDACKRRRYTADPGEIEALGGRLRTIEQHLGISRIIS